MQIQGWWGRLLAAMLLLGACSSTPSSTTVAAVDVPESSTTTVSPATSSTTVPVPGSTTTTLPIEIRLPDNDVDDPTEAIVAIFEYVSYLHTIPDVGGDYLDLVYLKECDCFDAVTLSLKEYSANTWVQDDDGIDVHEVLVTQSFENGNVLLQVTESWTPQYIRNAEGDRVRLERDEYENDTSLIGLELGADGRWRVAVIGLLGEPSEEVNP